MTKTFCVTTPIYYTNAKPHIGHAYTSLIADTLTRFHRQRGVDSFFLTGTDEHGINIERAAAAQGVPVKQYVDQIVNDFQTAFAPLEIEYSRWIRTTDPAHESAVQKLWQVIKDRGYIYKGYYDGWFCGNCNEFKEIPEGTEDPICPVHDKALDRISEESYFFKLSEFQQPLLDLYDSHPEFVQPDARRNEVRSFVAGGLKDLSVSRVSVAWGIPVPDDPKHTIYVWLDALSNYISALGWGNDKFDGFDRYWPALHLVGKDILRFHTVYWPAWLMAAGVPLPRGVHAHGMLLIGGRKMSKTLGNVIRVHELLRYFTADMVRYFVLREVSFGQDGYISYEAVIDRVNSDLADGLGNLASRTLTMVRNYFDGKPPRPSARTEEYAADVRARIAEATSRFDEEFSALNFSRGLEAAWAGIARVDKFITEGEPWKLAKDPGSRDKLEAILATAYEGLRHLVLLTAPAMPASARVIWQQMGLAGDPLRIDPNSLVWGEPIETARVEKVSPAFPKLNKEAIMTEVEKEGAASQAAADASGKGGAQPAAPKAATTEPPAQASQPAGPVAPANIITIDDFIKVELRAATVLEAERVPKADKLLRLIVDVGEAQPRQILAGIAQYYAPEEVLGRKIIIVANLAPRKLRGLESNGMLLAASIGDEGKPVLATFGEDVPNGARLK